MSPHVVLERAFESDAQYVADPGSGGVLRCDNRTDSVLRLLTGATGNRDVVSPSSEGQRLLVCCAGAPTTSVVLRFGSIASSAAGVYTATYLTGAKTAVNTVTLNAVGEAAYFVSVEDGVGTYKWMLVAGIGLAIT